MNPFVIFHKNCADGFGAACVAEQYFRGQKLDTPFFYAAQYGDSAPDVTGFDVFILDFSYPRDVLLKLKEQAKSIVVIDHHQTAQAALKGLDFCIFDMSKSGAMLTQEYFYPSQEWPLLLEYLQDRDLWLWQMPDSQAVSAAIRSYPFDFDVWAKWMQADNSVRALKTEGAAILRYQQQCVNEAMARPVELVEIGGHRVPCVNCTHLIGELGNELAKGHPFAALYFDTTEGKRVFSLRSTPEGVDVSEVAKSYGGGGHRNAAGFTIDKPKVL
jgi:oligoribonuclease NrnB/cAMP/cGMP phosphodiesterase (DHH superfamily)